MFGQNFFTNFEEDPFFRAHNESMERMMSQFHDPLFQGRQAMIDAPDPMRARGGQNNMLAARDMFPPMNIGNMESMFSNMHQHFGALANNPTSHSYSSSTVMSYSNNGVDEPKYYHATSSTRKAPGGVNEMKKSERDSHTGVHKIAIEQHIGERGHAYERSSNARTGETEERRNLYNMDNAETGQFDQEWRHRTRNMNNALGYQRAHRGPKRYQMKGPRALREKGVRCKETARNGRKDDLH